MENELFENTPVPKAYLKLALPVVLSSVLTLVYNLVDTYFIGQTGNADLVAGVSLCAPVFTLLIAMGDMFGLGGSSVISRLLGAGRKDDARRLSVFCLDGCFIFGILIAVILLVFRNPILHLLGTTEDTFMHAKGYYLWIAAGAPFVILGLAPSNLLRTEGHANAAMIGSVLGSIINIILDPVFIFTLNKGAAGAAIATIIGNIGADIFYVMYIRRHASVLSFRVKDFRISAHELKEIFSIGIPSSITNLVQSIGVVLMNNALLPYGNQSIAAYGIVAKVTMIVIMVLVGFAFGGQPLYGYLYGAQKKTRLKEAIRFAFVLELSLACALSLILYVNAGHAVALFIDNQAIVGAGTPMLRALLAGMPFMSVVLIITCLFQSTGKAWQALVLSASRQGIVFALMLVILGRLLGYDGILHAQPASDILTALLAVFLVRKSLLEELKETENITAAA